MTYHKASQECLSFWCTASELATVAKDTCGRLEQRHRAGATYQACGLRMSARKPSYSDRMQSKWCVALIRQIGKMVYVVDSVIQ